MSEREIQVSVRIRPVVGPARGAHAAAVDILEDGAVRVRLAASSSTPEASGLLPVCFRYASHVVQGSDQTVAFEALASKLIQRARAGYDCTLMAYGQTGSGKTHTMFGPAGCLTEASVQQAGKDEVPSEWGLFPRTVLTMMHSCEGGQPTLHASAVEVYHENVFDLLEDRAQLMIGTAKPIGQKVGGEADLGGNAHRAINGVHPACCTCFKCFQMQEKAKQERGKGGYTALSSAAARGRGGNGGKGAGEDQFSTVGEKLMPLRCAEDVARFARTVEATRSARGHLLNDRSSRRCVSFLNCA